MHSKLKRLTKISTMGFWSSRLGTRFCYPPRVLDSMAPPNCSSIFLDHLRSEIGLETLHTSCSYQGRLRVCTMLSL